MLVYKECFNIIQIAHACLRRIFQCRRVYLNFTYNDIYICYKWIIRFFMSLGKICYNVDFSMTKDYVNSVKFIHRNFEMLSKKKKKKNLFHRPKALRKTDISSKNELAMKRNK